MKNNKTVIKSIKALFPVIMVLLMMLSLAACGGGSGDSGESESSDADFTWTREGYFTDENNNSLSVTKSDDDENEGWYVGVMIGDDSYGWYITQEGDTLHGDLNGGSDDGDAYVVTVSEEGDDGLALEVEGGDTYHFTPMEDADASDDGGSVLINVEGSGQIAYTEEGGTPEFSDDNPIQSAQINLQDDSKYVFAAKADEGSKFVKWTKDGEDYSEDAQITVEFSKDDVTDLVAVFE